MSKDGDLVDLSESPLAGNVRILGEYDPEWEIDKNALTIMEKIGELHFSYIMHRMIDRHCCCTRIVLLPIKASLPVCI